MVPWQTDVPATQVENNVSTSLGAIIRRVCRQDYTGNCLIAMVDFMWVVISIVSIA
jgi:hypothetical protein